MSVVFGMGLSLLPLQAQDAPPKETQPPVVDQAQSQAWAGNLLDAGCRISAPADKCEVTETTQLFGLATADAKYYRFDGDGNTKVLTALKSTDKRTGAIKVSINGTLTGETLKVETVEIR